MNNSSIRFNMTKATFDHTLDQPSDHTTDHHIDPETVSQELLTLIEKWLTAEGAYTTPTQQQMLASHVNAMVLRAKTGESLPEVDLSLFDEISPESIKLAAQIVEILPELAVEEVYLLSVHFEIARSNP